MVPQPSLLSTKLQNLHFILSHQIDVRYQRTEAIQELSLKTAQIKVYHEKLLTIRKTMATLHDRSTRLKRRALKLQTEKQKEALAKATARDKEREREKKLVAKTDCASSPNST